MRADIPDVTLLAQGSATGLNGLSAGTGATVRSVKDQKPF
jgi:hypothetical protein